MAISLSPLRISAGFFQTEYFEPWDATAGEWEERDFTGRIYVFDRFKSIYPRPTRRETLGIADDVVLPDSLVLRQRATGDIYIVSSTNRTDVAGQTNIYDRAVALHRTSTLGTQYRYTPTGTGDDLGAAVETEIGTCWYDLELRSEAPEQPAYSLQQGDMIGKFFVTVPDSVDLQEDDYILSADSTFHLRVDILYQDSGFKLFRAVKMAPAFEDMVYELRTGVAGSYNPTTGAVTDVTRADRIFSGYVGESIKDNQDIMGNVGYSLEVWVLVTHIGFTPVAGDYVRVRSLRYHIDSVKRSHSGTKYQLNCRRATQ